MHIMPKYNIHDLDIFAKFHVIISYIYENIFLFKCMDLKE